MQQGSVRGMSSTDNGVSSDGGFPGGRLSGAPVDSKEVGMEVVHCACGTRGSEEEIRQHLYLMQDLTPEAHYVVAAES